MAWTEPAVRTETNPRYCYATVEDEIIMVTHITVMSHECHGISITSISTVCLTYWGRVTHIYVSKLTTIDSDNGLSPERHQAIIWTNAGILLTGPLGINFNEIFIKIHTFSFKKINLKMSSGKWSPFCLGLNVLTHWGRDKVDAISQTTVSDTFSWMKIFEFRLKLHWNLLPRVESIIFQHWFR